MKIKILAKEVEMDSHLEDYIQKRIGALGRLLKNEEESYCDLRIGKDSSSHKHGRIFFAEAKIKTTNKNYGAKADGESLESAIDELKDELSKKIRRHKDKKLSLRNKGGRVIKKLLRKIKKEK